MVRTWSRQVRVPSSSLPPAACRHLRGKAYPGQGARVVGHDNTDGVVQCSCSRPQAVAKPLELVNAVIAVVPHLRRAADLRCFRRATGSMRQVSIQTQARALSRTHRPRDVHAKVADLLRARRCSCCGRLCAYSAIRRCLCGHLWASPGLLALRPQEVQATKVQRSRSRDAAPRRFLQALKTGRQARPASTSAQRLRPTFTRSELAPSGAAQQH